MFILKKHNKMKLFDARVNKQPHTAQEILRFWLHHILRITWLDCRIHEGKGLAHLVYHISPLSRTVQILIIYENNVFNNKINK